VVLDPFLGIGSSAIAARDCGVGKFYGFEIDEYYAEIARERLHSEESQFVELRSARPHSVISKSVVLSQ
jgi:DNA modification methylase